jgi:hypothetical protein
VIPAPPGGVTYEVKGKPHATLRQGGRNVRLHYDPAAPAP